MKQEHISIHKIPAIVWGDPSDKVLLCVHGKMSSKESAEGIAALAQEKGYQVIIANGAQSKGRTIEIGRASCRERV